MKYLGQTSTITFTIKCLIQRSTPWVGMILVSWSLGFWFNQTFLTPDVQWLKWLYDHKRDRLIKTQGQSRIIILGGSGTFFGIDSEILEKNLLECCDVVREK